MVSRTSKIPVYVHRDPSAAKTHKKEAPSKERPPRGPLAQAGPSFTLPQAPIDSPRNPCGRQHKWLRLTQLPPPLNPMLSHLPLVFTIVHTKAAARQPPVYRRVHVPRNYTITHVRAMVMYLFDATLYDGDLFSREHHTVEICRNADFPGNLWSAETYVKLSGAQNPYTPINDNGPELGEADEPEISRSGDYRWEGEGDLTIDSVWPTSKILDQDREHQNERHGIIFKFARQSQIQVHVTFDAAMRAQAPFPMNEPFVVDSSGLTTLLSSTSKRRTAEERDWNEPHAFKNLVLLPINRPTIPRPARRSHVTPDALPAHKKAVSIRAIDIARMAKSAFLREFDELDSPPPRQPAPGLIVEDEDSFWDDDEEAEAIWAEQMKHVPLSFDDDSDDEDDVL
ncbi:hypothetical protein BD626DRAFT_507748 [Schizophyllum amplum]|uniref:Uncharacterized protein n=1 Tax=Schizophyllum amplum TaxID=97359 RepID=A0A550C4G1_9AGAR|nr:hypothetical protein BD626DRAFT_507748 [Auriculariopsis ampla]